MKKAARVIFRRLASALLALAAGSAVSQPDPGRNAEPVSVSPRPRVITISPHATEMIYAAGAGATLVATVSSSDYPEAARNLPRVGDGILLNQERIFMLQPTLLIGWLRSSAAQQIEPMVERLGAQMEYSRPLQLRDIPAEVLRLGRLLGYEETAAGAAEAMLARIAVLEDRYAHLAPVSVFIEVGSRPLYTIGDDPLLNDALRVCGAVNLYANSGIPAPRVPIESVLVKNPRLLIVTGDEQIKASEVQARWRQFGLAAAAEGRIHVADPDELYRPGPRLIDAVEALCPAVDAARRGSNSAQGPHIK